MARPAEFERSNVVQQATEVFWRRGYGATSVSDLVAATGLQPGSIYAAFGSKKGLFLEVLDEYNDRFIGTISSRLESGGSPLAAIRALFDLIIEDAVSEKGQCGCLAVNTLLEMAAHDEEIAVRLHRHSDRMQALLQAALAQARKNGELGINKNPEQLTIFVMNNLLGLRVMCKHPPKREELRGIVDGVMSAFRSSP